MAVISVDLAYKRWRDLGIAMLSRRDRTIDVAFIRPPDAPLAVDPLATYLDHLCDANGVRLLLLDGPQAWKDDANGFEHARVCERRLNTPAKTGLPRFVKPAAYGSFVRFSVAVYDALANCGWTRLERCDDLWDGNRKTLVESFPLSAWKSLGMQALGSKRKAKPADITAKLDEVQALLPLTLADAPTHDELQALVAGLAGIAMEEGAIGTCDVAGVAPFMRDGSWREGFIVNPTMRPGV